MELAKIEMKWTELNRSTSEMKECDKDTIELGGISNWNWIIILAIERYSRSDRMVIQITLAFQKFEFCHFMTA
jgi:hypothetical protein